MDADEGGGDAQDERARLMGLLFFISVLFVFWGWSASHRARERHARAEPLLKSARIGGVLEGAIATLSTVEQHQVRTLPTGDPRRLAIIYHLLDDLEERDVLAPAEVETALGALDVASGRR